MDSIRYYTHPLPKIHITPKANNETYAIKEILKEPDKLELLKAMEVEAFLYFK